MFEEQYVLCWRLYLTFSSVQMASAGFYWCGTESQPDLVRCFVCLQDFEDWDPDDIPKYYFPQYTVQLFATFTFFSLCKLGMNTGVCVQIAHL